jgi:hypothetical protein
MIISIGCRKSLQQNQACFRYENGTMRPAETVLRGKEEE